MCVKSPESSICGPSKRWLRCSAAIKNDEFKRVADAIWEKEAVRLWISAAVDNLDSDSRACSSCVDYAVDKRAYVLVGAIINALFNARQPWLTPQAHRHRYVNLAERLEAALGYKPGLKRIEKLRRDLESERALRVGYTAVTAPTHAGPTGRRPDKAHKLGRLGAAIVRIAEKAGLADAPLPTVSADAGEVSSIYWPPLAELASCAKVFAKAAGDPEAAAEAAAEADPNWTQPRPNAIRNIFILELTDFQRSNFGSASHALTADIVEGLVHAAFLGRDEYVTRKEVEVLTRQRRTKPIRMPKQNAD